MMDQRKEEEEDKLVRRREVLRKKRYEVGTEANSVHPYVNCREVSEDRVRPIQLGIITL